MVHTHLTRKRECKDYIYSPSSCQLRVGFCLSGTKTLQDIKRKFNVTTQIACRCVSDTLQQHWRSHFSVCNVKHRNEPVATDTEISDTPAVDSGAMAAQLFVRRESLVADVCGLKTDKDNIPESGAMDKLISDCAKTEMSTCVKEFLCALCIST
jgi:hypothetical protein